MPLFRSDVAGRISKKSVICSLCGEKDLRWQWDFFRKKSNLMRLVRLRDQITSVWTEKHVCPPGTPKRLVKCKFCPVDNLFWQKNEKGRFVLLESSGSSHQCPEFKVNILAHKEALRENYYWEKKYVNDRKDTTCKKCKGLGYKVRKQRNPRFIKMKGCRPCRSLGKFTEDKISWYLEGRRKKYWPPPIMWRHLV